MKNMNFGTIVLKYNLIAVGIFVVLGAIASITKNDSLSEISMYASFSVLVPYLVYSFTFFLVSAKYPAIAFGFMFAAIGVKFVLTGICFGYSITQLPQESLFAFTMLCLGTMFLPYISQIFIRDTVQNKVIAS